MKIFSFRSTAPLFLLLATVVVGCGADSTTGPDQRTLSMIDQGAPIQTAEWVAGGEDYEVSLGNESGGTPLPKGVVAACPRDGVLSFSWVPPVDSYVARIFWNGEMIGEAPACDGLFLWAMPRRITGIQNFLICYQRTGVDGPALDISVELASYAGEEEDPGMTMEQSAD